MSEVKRVARVAIEINRAVHAFICLGVTIALGAKVLAANDIDGTFADDPLGLWVAVGVFMLLIDSWSRWFSSLLAPSTTETRR